MINYPDIFGDALKCALTLTSGDLVLTDDDLSDFRLYSAINSGTQLSYGSCESDSIYFTCDMQASSLVGKVFTVTLTPEGNQPIPIGKYKIASCEKDSGNSEMTCTGYDMLYDINGTDCSAWLNGLTYPMTLKQYRDSFAAWLGVEQETRTLINDNYVIEKKQISGVVSGSMIMRAIAQLNACFGHISRNGKLDYIALGNTAVCHVDNDTYYDFTAGDDDTAKITKVTIRETTDDVGGSAGTDGEVYTITGNYLTFGTGTETREALATNILNAIKDVTYRPTEMEMLINPALELGDKITTEDYDGNVHTTYILQNNWNGIVFQDQTLKAGGEAHRYEEINSISSQIQDAVNRSASLVVKVEGIEAEVSEKLDVEGGETKKTSWSLKPEAFTVKSNGQPVLKVDKDGLEVTGKGTFSGVVHGAEITGSTLVSDDGSDNSTSVTIAEGQLKAESKVTGDYSIFSRGHMEIVNEDTSSRAIVHPLGINFSRSDGNSQQFVVQVGADNCYVTSIGPVEMAFPKVNNFNLAVTGGTDKQFVQVGNKDNTQMWLHGDEIRLHSDKILLDGKVANDVVLEEGLEVKGDILASDGDFSGQITEGGTTLKDKYSAFISPYDSAMLGYVVPKEMPVQNYLVGRVFHQRVGRVDMGTLNWGVTDTNRFYTTSLNTVIKKVGDNAIANIWVEGYTPDTANNVINNKANKHTSVGSTGTFSIRDTSYTSSQTLKADLSGKYLYYELATEVTKYIDGNELLANGVIKPLGVLQQISNTGNTSATALLLRGGSSAYSWVGYRNNENTMLGYIGCHNDYPVYSRPQDNKTYHIPYADGSTMHDALVQNSTSTEEKMWLGAYSGTNRVGLGAGKSGAYGLLDVTNDSWVMSGSGGNLNSWVHRCKTHASRMQVGTVTIASGTTQATVTFGTAFAGTPMVFLTPANANAAKANGYVASVTANNFMLAKVTATYEGKWNWLAIYND